MLFNQYAKELFSYLNLRLPLTSFRKTGNNYIGVFKNRVLAEDKPYNYVWQAIYNKVEKLKDYSTPDYKAHERMLSSLKQSGYQVVDCYNDNPSVYCEYGLNPSDKKFLLKTEIASESIMANSKGDEKIFTMYLTIKGEINTKRQISVRYNLDVTFMSTDF